MSKFKVGDEVKVVRRVELPNWYRKMKDVVMNKVGKIENISSDRLIGIEVAFSTDIGTWNFHPDCLELVKQKDEVFYA